MVVYTKHKRSRIRIRRKWLTWSFGIVVFALSMLLAFKAREHNQALQSTNIYYPLPIGPQAPPVIHNMRMGDGRLILGSGLDGHYVRLRWRYDPARESIVRVFDTNYTILLVFAAPDDCLEYCSNVVYLPSGRYIWHVFYIENSGEYSLQADEFTLFDRELVPYLLPLVKE